ncbi:type IV secretory system conjugative DNA transfer family protein [Candidatus Nephthysia bennettiae]|uniref:Type IV secretory system conjugative DNA transfer family protein n=1 Tax=Candidatus Nephthysia bennettiae TaxID=3127016 RepID=A0A934KB15_9BACT|nr:type IV secretory system conjugative DNA transfer family protein [Candidatus Dormibacteraeota bacterium]MBJ7611925.1 type IV secretory system conjugative DNA transfer family protein [Candidatus Dormibacteraeota bacterium]
MFVGLPALVAAWKAPEVRGVGWGLMLLGVALAVPTGLLVRSWWRRSPFDISARLPRRLSTRARVQWRERVFLGWTQGWLGGPRFAFGLPEDSVGIVGPTRVNKTAGIGIPQVLMWGGPLISLAPKPDMFRDTAAKRRELAKIQGGRVLIYAPTVRGRVEGLVPVRFSPSSTTDATEIGLRVDSWTEAAGTGKNVENGDHWATSSKRILRGLFLASAHHPRLPGDFTVVHGWLTAGLAATSTVDHPLLEPIGILRGLSILKGDKYAADLWASELEGVLGTTEKERSGFFSAALTTVAAVSNPTVLRSAEATDFDAEEFLLSGSSLYIVSPTEHQRAVAPLLSMLIQSIVHTAYRLHREGRLPHRLLVSLDDLANCAPLPQLESIISQGGGQGVNVAWNLQSLAQNEVNYGAPAARAIWHATRIKIGFGGLDSEAGAEGLSVAIGDERVVVAGQSETEKGPRGSKHVYWRRVLSVSQLREIPDGWALMLYHNLPPRMLREPLAAKRHQISRHMKPWAVAEAELEAATRAAEATDPETSRREG